MASIQLPVVTNATRLRNATNAAGEASSPSGEQSAFADVLSASLGEAKPRQKASTKESDSQDAPAVAPDPSASATPPAPAPQQSAASNSTGKDEADANAERVSTASTPSDQAAAAARGSSSTRAVTTNKTAGDGVSAFSVDASNAAADAERVDIGPEYVPGAITQASLQLQKSTGSLPVDPSDGSAAKAATAVATDTSKLDPRLAVDVALNPADRSAAQRQIGEERAEARTSALRSDGKFDPRANPTEDARATATPAALAGISSDVARQLSNFGLRRNIDTVEGPGGTQNIAGAMQSFLASAANASPNAVARTAVYDIKTPVGAPGWSDSLNQVVTLSVRDQIQEAEIRVQPRDLGPITVTLKLDGDSASVAFSAANSDTRALLESNLPQLKDTLAASGIALNGSSVDGGAAQSRGEFGQGARQASNHNDSNGTSESEARAPVRGLNRIVDTFA